MKSKIVLSCRIAIAKVLASNCGIAIADNNKSYMVSKLVKYHWYSRFILVGGADHAQLHLLPRLAVHHPQVPGHPGLPKGLPKVTVPILSNT
jgi:hypothetical protein